MRDDSEKRLWHRRFAAIQAEYERLYPDTRTADGSPHPNFLRLYEAFAEVYVRKALEAIAAGRQDFTVYVIEAEQAAGIMQDDPDDPDGRPLIEVNLTAEEMEALALAHRGCAVVVVRVDDVLDEVFEEWESAEVERSTEAYLAEINNSVQLTYALTNSRLYGDNLLGLFAEYDRWKALMNKNSFRRSRVDSWVDVPASWRPGEWHHVAVVWDDELGDGGVEILLDQQEETEVHQDVYGPLTVFGSRLASYYDEFFPGPFVLDRVSPEGGQFTSDIVGERVRLSARATLADYRVYDDLFGIVNEGTAEAPAWALDQAFPPQKRYADQEATYDLRFDFRSLGDFEPVTVPKGTKLQGHVRIRSQVPTILQLPEGWTQDRMAAENVSVVDARMGSDPVPAYQVAAKVGTGFATEIDESGRIPDGIWLRNAGGAYMQFSVRLGIDRIAEDAQLYADPAEFDEIDQGRRTPLVESVELHLLVPIQILAWTEHVEYPGRERPPLSINRPTPALVITLEPSASSEEPLDAPDPAYVPPAPLPPPSPLLVPPGGFRG